MSRLQESVLCYGGRRTRAGDPAVILFVFLSRMLLANEVGAIHLRRETVFLSIIYKDRGSILPNDGKLAMH